MLDGCSLFTSRYGYLHIIIQLLLLYFKDKDMNIFSHFQKIVSEVVSDLITEGEIPADLDLRRVLCTPTRVADHGDLTTNAAMILASKTGLKASELAKPIAAALEKVVEVVKVTIAEPGFINFCLSDSFWLDQLYNILQVGIAYGDAKFGDGCCINIEFVSANPTGPLHIGHGRGAVFGDVLATLLEKVGYTVTREYYINDAGVQVDILARSTYLRYREALGDRIDSIPDGFYPGIYLQTVGQALANRDGPRWLNLPESEWLEPVRNFAIDIIMTSIRSDLNALGVKHDVFVSEKSLVESRGVELVIQLLAKQQLIYEGVLDPPKGNSENNWISRSQMLFRATHFGDDIDRSLEKADGSWTYFATDLAYHLDKYRRGFSRMVNVWGADHGGYARRLQAAVQALTDCQAKLDIKLCQIVNLLDNGQIVKMSKRAGSFVTLRSVIDQVGRDAIRFSMLTRSSDTHLDFDLSKVIEQSRDNPIFYIQYAHARACSVQRRAEKIFPETDLAKRETFSSVLHRLSNPMELNLIKLLSQWPLLVANAAETYEPHRVAYYLCDLASTFHELWNRGNDAANMRFLVLKDRELSLARLALVQGVMIVLASGLAIFGIEPVKEMR